MGFKHARWDCDNCGKVLFVGDNENIKAMDLCRLPLTSGHAETSIPSYVRKTREVLCYECMEHHEHIWNKNERKNKNKNINFISELTR